MRYSLLFFYFIISVSYCFHTYVLGAENINTYEMNKRRSTKLINDFINSPEDEDALMQARQAVRDEIAKEKIEYDEEGDEITSKYRILIYTRMYTCLQDNKHLPLSKKRSLFDLLSEGLVNDNDFYLKQRILGHLTELIDGKDNSYLSESFVNNVEKAYRDEDLQNRHIVFLLAYIKSPLADAILNEYANVTFDPEGGYNTVGWAAILLMAQRGNIEAIKKMLSLAENEHANIKFGTLFNDISSVHHEMCVQYLYKYLMSDYRVFPLRPGDPGVLLAGSAAHALGNMLVGFPECRQKYYPKADDLEPFRQWMSQQKQFKFK